MLPGSEYLAPCFECPRPQLNATISARVAYNESLCVSPRISAFNCLGVTVRTVFFIYHIIHFFIYPQNTAYLV
ncbi:hypothetical protein JM93_03311 [Roseibium hamelinense]|uniref:Uncharacterized protein n=1 Tax=Roseibium hamelinense TaxID=150831 RepID=A0A562SN95_9HYPH|nr:hypothetical protein JM93_03311 [Roseibium hamelinense]